MAAIDLDKLDAKGLKRVIKKAERLLAKKQSTEEAKFLRQMKKQATAQGLDFSSVVGRIGGAPAGAEKPKAAAAKRGRKAAKVAPKYRHPENAALTWSGRGRTPKWVQEFKNKGQLKKIEIA